MRELLGANSVYYPGHSTCRIATSAGENIIVDPWLADNPETPDSKQVESTRTLRSTPCSQAKSLLRTRIRRRKYGKY